MIVFYCISNWFWPPPRSLNSSTPFSATFGFPCSWLLQSQHSVWGQRCLRVGFFHTLKKTSMWLAPVFIKDKCETKMYGKRNLENLMSQQLFLHCKNLMNCSCWETLQKRTSWTTIVKFWIYLNFSGKHQPLDFSAPSFSTPGYWSISRFVDRFKSCMNQSFWCST